MKLRDIMRPGTLTISDTDVLGVAYAAMNRSHVRHLPVMHGEHLVGILSERDVLAARARAEGRGWWDTPVASAMHSPAQTAGPDDSLTEAAGRMAFAKLGALPIVDGGKLVGMVTVTDILDGEVRAAVTPTKRPGATAADVMTSYPYAVRPEAYLADAVVIMVDHRVRHLPVVDASSAIVGMLSDRDVRSAVGEPANYEVGSGALAQHKVGDVMSRPGGSVPFDTPIGELARRLADDKIGALAVTDRFGALIGIVSYVDVLRAYARST